MREVEVNGNLYRVGQMAAFDQIHVARRFAPVIASFFDILGALPQDASRANIFDFLKSENLSGLASALSEMSDEHANYVMAMCLSVCYRVEGDGAPVPLWNKGAKRAQYDLKSGEIIQLVRYALEENVSDFLPTSQ